MYVSKKLEPRWGIIVGSALLSAFASADWKAPSNPEPVSILNEARLNAESGDYSLALEKLSWFFSNAVNLDGSLYGVRLTSALPLWVDLADEYPPALAALSELRDEKTQNVMEKANDLKRDYRKQFDAFVDMAAINDALRESEKTVEVFQYLDAHAPGVAKRVYDIAQKTLYESNEWDTCGKYIEPLESYAKTLNVYRVGRELSGEKEPAKRGIEDAQVEAMLLRETCLLIVILVKNERSAEAEVIAEHLTLKSTYPRKSDYIDDAMRGDHSVVDRISLVGQKN